VPQALAYLVSDLKQREKRHAEEERVRRERAQRKLDKRKRKRKRSTGGARRSDAVAYAAAAAAASAAHKPADGKRRSTLIVSAPRSEDGRLRALSNEHAAVPVGPVEAPVGDPSHLAPPAAAAEGELVRRQRSRSRASRHNSLQQANLFSKLRAQRARDAAAAAAASAAAASSNNSSSAAAAAGGDAATGAVGADGGDPAVAEFLKSAEAVEAFVGAELLASEAAACESVLSELAGVPPQLRFYERQYWAVRARGECSGAASRRGLSDSHTRTRTLIARSLARSRRS
jgi:hypothetical protein